MSEKKLGWGIIATGGIAGSFAKGVLASKTGKLVAVGSRTQAAAEKFGSDFLKGHAVKRYGSYEALLADPDVQAVYVATPHPMHAEWAIKAAKAKKHVLCEKPIAINWGDAQVMVEAAHENGVFLMEAYMYRCHPQIQKILDLIKSGAIGQVRAIQSNFSFHWPRPMDVTCRLTNHALAGGGILDVGGYCATFTGLIAGAANGKSYASPLMLQAAGQIGSESRVDEYTYATAKYEGDIIATMGCGVQCNMDNSSRIYGTDGWIHIENVWTPGETAKMTLYQRDKEAEEIVIKADRPLYALEADACAEAIFAGKKEAAHPAMSWNDTLANMRLLDQWRAAIGMTYDMERPGKVAIVGQNADAKLAVRNDIPAGVNMLYGQVEGVSLPVSRLIFGADKWNLGRYAHAAAMYDDYFQRGGNAWDTAFIYGGGEDEKVLGEWIHSRGIRNQVVLLDKGAHTPECDPKSLTQQLMISLDRLKTDYVDIYMLHRDNLDIPIEEFVDVLNEHKKAGRMRAFGGSNWSKERVEAFNTAAKRKGLTGMCGVSNNFSLARMIAPVWDGCIASSTEEYKAWHEQTQIPVLSWSSQARGFFVRGEKSFTADRELARCWYSDANFQRQARAKELAKKYGVTPIQIALAYVLRQPFPTFALIGPFMIEETRSSFEAMKINLTREEVLWLDLCEKK